MTKWLTRVKRPNKQTGKGNLRRLIASVLIYSQFIQLAAAAVLPNTSSQAPLFSTPMHGKPLTANTPIPALPFAPLIQYAQTGTFNPLSLTNQQLGLSGPLNWGITYSDLTGTYLNTQYVLPLGERWAVGALGEYGSGQYRINGTLGYGSPTAQIKFTAERLGQRLPFQFDSGDIESRVHQEAYGARFQRLFNAPFLQGMNLGGYYADASSKNLNPIIFTSDGNNCGGFASGLQCINYRHLTGAISTGADAGIDLLLTPSTLVSANLYYDQVRYHPIFTHTVDEDRNGLGGGVRFNQLFNGRFKFIGEATVREIYNTYQAGLSWLPNLQKTKLGIELSLFGQHLTSHNATPDNNSVSLQVSLLGDGNKGYDERHQWGGLRLSAITQSVITPAIKMNQVLVIAEQITKLLAPSILSITPNNGPLMGGNTITITGSNFVQGLLVFLGEQLVTNIQVISPNLIQIIVPATSSPGSVNVIIQNPDGQQALFPEGYTYVGNTQPVIQGITPSQGPVAGGTFVTITGSHLTGTTDVRFGGVSAIVTSVSDTQVIVTTPAGAAGAVDVVLTTPVGSVTLAGGYTYVSTPVITSINPTSGSVAGGTSVVITGTHFTGATSVNFGSIAATSFIVNSDTQITAVSPAGAAGVVDIQVTTAGGSSNPSPADQFTYVPAPDITSINPTSGPVAGGTSVVITGTNFTGATSVDFGLIAATSFIVNSDTQITAVSPAGAAGVVDITVTTTIGTSNTSPADQFTYVSEPIITSINPTSGSVAGGTSVVITGTHFTGATSVDFGSIAATSFIVNSDTQITAISPANAAGVVDIQVTTVGGTSNISPADQFTYVPAPIITSINPTSGPVTGATSVVITGAHFTGASSVNFGSIAATSFIVNSDTQITAVSPAGAAGVVDIQVTTTYGSSAASPADQFTYVPAPDITSINPTSGPVAGATSVVITGAHFTGATSVNFGSTAATSFIVNSDTQITAVSPAGAAGVVDIQVTTTYGSSTASPADQFTYVPQPIITNINPTSGSVAGATSVVITGTHFTGATSVDFGSIAATSFIVNSDTQITAVSPAGAAGVVDITVTTVGGTSNNTPADQFTYVPQPIITSISPTIGPISGATSVVMTGTNFTGATNVDFGSIAAASFIVDSDTQITAVSPTVSSAGIVNITVTTVGGTSITSPADQFTYYSMPVITGISPASGPVAGATSVVITGTNFTGATSVAFGSTAATSFIVNSATQITAVSPAGAAGVVDITVTTANGTSSTSPADQFTYVSLPTITGISPTSGPVSGGTSVVITGTNFTGATSVNFGSIAATNFIVNSATQITAVSPSGSAAGVVDIRVITAGGTSPINNADKFTYVLAVGDSYGGGAIYQITGSTAFVVSLDDVPSSGATMPWSITIQADATSSSNGFTNTYSVLNTANYPAAAACRGYNADNAMGQWFLPAQSQWATLGATPVLTALNTNPSFVQFTAGAYWTSTQSGTNNAQTRFFTTSSTMSSAGIFGKSVNTVRVRCARSLSLP